jgi:hypothetical protein
MKKDKFTKKNVINNVRKTRTWFFKVFLGLLFAVLIFFISVWFTAQELVQNRAFELASFIKNDLEVIKDYWQTTLVMVWEELPRNIIFICDASIIFLIALYIFLKKKLPFVNNLASGFRSLRKRLI